MAFEPKGGTRIGANLREKILKPFIFDVLDRGDKLERPYLILTITDGSPEGEEEDQFRNAIVECSRRLVQRNYKPDAVMFLISQVGTYEGAEKFLDRLEEDRAVRRVLFRTAEHLDEKYEQNLEQWLLEILLSPIIKRTD
ncbi:hypothetical protein MMC31_002469 [Peltigera leucophlebia]|nr:hypothetical protein [Peltigera leucophlebia]